MHSLNRDDAQSPEYNGYKKKREPMTKMSKSPFKRSETPAPRKLLDYRHYMKLRLNILSCAKTMSLYVNYIRNTIHKGKL